MKKEFALIIGFILCIIALAATGKILIPVIIFSITVILWVILERR